MSDCLISRKVDDKKVHATIINVETKYQPINIKNLYPRWDKITVDNISLNKMSGPMLVQFTPTAEVVGYNPTNGNVSLSMDDGWVTINSLKIVDFY